MKKTIYLFSLIVFFIQSFQAKAQSCDWSISTINIVQSTCEANGKFTIKISGAGASNLSDIKYSIPSTGLGSVEVYPNPDPNFTNLPKGTYTVKVDAFCNSTLVSKTTSVTVGGSYTSPTLATTIARNTLDNCTVGYGKIRVNMTGSSKPYTIKITPPAGYTGPTSFSTSSSSLTIENLTAGAYIVELLDNCGNGPTPQTVTIKSLSVQNIGSAIRQSSLYTPLVENCSAYRVTAFTVNPSVEPDWVGYSDIDTPLQYAIAFTEDIAGTKTAYKPTYHHSPQTEINLPAGKTYKSFYGNLSSTLFTIFIKTPCGDEFITPSVNNLLYEYWIKVFALDNSSEVYCNGFSQIFNAHSQKFVCLPLTVKIEGRDGTVYNKTYTLTSRDTPLKTDVLNFGKYKATITTADGYLAEQTFEKTQSAQPYTVQSPTINVGGINGQAINIRISRTNGGEYFPINTVIKLKSAPPGYNTSWSKKIVNTVTSYCEVSGRADISTEGRYILPGTYVFEITDDCGTYEVSTTLLLYDTYVYTINTSNREVVCGGLKITPTGYAMNRGVQKDIYFKIYSGPPGYPTTVIPSGGSITLQTPGEYKIMAAATSSVFNNYGDINMAVDTIIVESTIPKMNVGVSQGFACINTQDHEGQISIRATNGKAPYHYYLYPSENDAKNNTNLISDNIVGDFSILNLMKNQTYWVKMVDNCGAPGLQSLKILDLSTAELVSVNKNSFCEGDTIKFSAIAMPRPQYAWTGPNGFTSTIRNPIVPDVVKSLHSGNYQVKITSDYCGTPNYYTVPITINNFGVSTDIVLSDVTICRGESATLTPTGSVTNPTYVWYSSQTSLTPIFTGSVFTTPALTATKTYYVAVYGDDKCENKINNRKEVTVTVASCVQAVNDYVKVFECDNIIVNVLGNDAISGIGSTTVTVTSAPTHGTTTISGGTNINYINAACNGGNTDIFTYNVCKGTDCSSANVYVAILNNPDIELVEDCTFEPKLVAKYQYPGASYNWEHSSDGGATWNSVGTNSPELKTTEAGTYRFTVTFDGISKTSIIRTLTINKKTLIPQINKYLYELGLF